MIEFVLLIAVVAGGFWAGRYFNVDRQLLQLRMALDEQRRIAISLQTAFSQLAAAIVVVEPGKQVTVPLSLVMRALKSQGVLQQMTPAEPTEEEFRKSITEILREEYDGPKVSGAPDKRAQNDAWFENNE